MCLRCYRSNARPYVKCRIATVSPVSVANVGYRAKDRMLNLLETFTDAARSGGSVASGSPVEGSRRDH